LIRPLAADEVGEVVHLRREGVGGVALPDCLAAIACAAVDERLQPLQRLDRPVERRSRVRHALRVDHLVGVVGAGLVSIADPPTIDASIFRQPVDPPATTAPDRRAVRSACPGREVAAVSALFFQGWSRPS